MKQQTGYFLMGLSIVTLLLTITFYFLTVYRVPLPSQIIHNTQDNKIKDITESFDLLCPYNLAKSDNLHLDTKVHIKCIKDQFEGFQYYVTHEKYIRDTLGDEKINDIASDCVFGDVLDWGLLKTKLQFEIRWEQD